MPDKMQKTRKGLVHCWLEKSPKSHFYMAFFRSAIFLLFWDVFSPHRANIIFQSFASCQESQEKSSENKQAVVWKNLKISVSAVFHILSCFEQGDYKSVRVGPYCFGLITCLGTKRVEIIFDILQILTNPSMKHGKNGHII